MQILGLVGHDGISPLDRYLPAAHGAWGTAAYWRLPTLFWIAPGDTMLVAGTVVGAGLGVLVMFDRLVDPRSSGCSRSTCPTSRPARFHELPVGPAPARERIPRDLPDRRHAHDRLALSLLVFRFLFLAGVVKLVSGDATWRSLTALEYHFWTQPLPTPLAWYAAQPPTGCSPRSPA